MFKYVVFYTLSALFAFSGALRAAEECDSYAVMRGDTLRLIAERYYGARSLSPVIYSRNIDVIGEDPNTIEIGMELSIPCREGIRMPLPRAFMAIIEPSRPTISDTDTQPFLAKAGATPFMDGEGKGIVPGILAAALRKAGYRGALTIGRPDSAADVLQLSSSTPDTFLSFPWIKPDCENPAGLSAQSLDLCRNYIFSDPLYEITLGLFVRAGDPLTAAQTAADFVGKSFCVPSFHSQDYLLQNGIIDLQGPLVRAQNFESCLSGLEDGRFDVIFADYQSQQSYAQSAQTQISDIPAFAHTATLHAVAYSQNPQALEVLETTNTGLKQILASGEWFNIVNQNLAVPTN